MNLLAQIDFTGFTALLAILLGLIGAMTGNLITEYRKGKAEKRRMASAFAGEIEAIMAIARARKIKEMFLSGIEIYQKGGKWGSWSWPISDDYFSVYRQNVDKIGLFDVPIPAKLATFYTFAFAITETLTSMGQHWDFNNKDTMIQSLTEELELLKRVESLGEELIQILQAVAK